jgi:antitoxin YefM
MTKVRRKYWKTRQNPVNPVRKGSAGHVPRIVRWDASEKCRSWLAGSERPVGCGHILLYKEQYNTEEAMEVVGYSAARQRLAKLMDSVVEDRDPVVVTRRGAKSVVMLSLEEYEAMAETLHLLRSPKNARRLQKAIRDAEARRFVRNPRA